MTKKHFIALADAIREHDRIASSEYDREFRPFADEHLKMLADFCQLQNPRFNRSRWLAYVAGECGPNGGNRK